eukprot:1047511-Pyramimonas_sp.AAC.1
MCNSSGKPLSRVGALQDVQPMARRRTRGVTGVPYGVAKSRPDRRARSPQNLTRGPPAARCGARIHPLANVGVGTIYR